MNNYIVFYMNETHTALREDMGIYGKSAKVEIAKP